MCVLWQLGLGRMRIRITPLPIWTIDRDHYVTHTAASAVLWGFAGPIALHIAPPRVQVRP